MNPPGLSSAAISTGSSRHVYAPHIREKIKTIGKHIQECENLDPAKAVVLQDEGQVTGIFLPAETIALLGAEESIHRASAILPPLLEPIMAIQGMTTLMKKGLPVVTRNHPDDILIQSAASGSEELFTVPFEYGLQAPEQKTRQFIATARDVAKESLKNLAERREELSKGLAEPISPEDWKKWMTVLKLRMQNASKRMEGVPSRYEKVRQFIQNLKDKLAEKRQNNFLIQFENETQAERASNSKSRLVKKKARQKTAKAQKSASFKINEAAASSGNRIVAGANRSASPGRVDAAQGVFPSFEERLRAELASRYPESRPLKPLAGFNVGEARQLMQERWNAAWNRANNHEEGVVVYSGSD